MTEPARIRAAEPADSPDLARVAAETFPLACPPDAPAESIAAFIEGNLLQPHFEAYLADPARRVIVVDDGDRLGGYAMAVLGDPQDPDVAGVTLRPTLELSKCYVVAEHHGDGSAARLMDAVIELARGLGVASVWLGVNQQNARANRYYAKHGFEIVGTKRFRLGERVEHDYVRELPLR